MRLPFQVALVLCAAGTPLAAQHPASHGAAAAPDTTLRGDQVAVAQTIRAVFAAVERKDLAALETLYAGDSLTVVEGAGINRGWADYRDTHLGPELRELQNLRYRPFELQVRASGNLAWATFRYAIAGQLGERTLDQVGRGTAILERRGAWWVVRHTQTSSRARRPNDPPMP